MRKSKQDKDIEEAKSALRSKRRKKVPFKAADMLSTGSTLHNLALSGKINGGVEKGSCVLDVGDSDSGKTWRGVTFLAEAAANEAFDDYRLIFDKTNEDGTKIDIEYHFGKKLAKRIEPPGKDSNGEEVHSTTIEEMFDFIDDARKEGKPFIYVADSIDAVSTEAELKKDAENKKLRRKAKSPELAKTKGSMGDGKAKLISSKLRQAMPKIQKSGSILILLNQAKDAVGDITFGYGPKPKARAGGRSPVYYSQVQYWSEKGADLKREFKGKKVSVGNIIKIDVKRTRFTGRRTSIQYPIYWSNGIDDVGSCINFLIDWQYWEGSLKNGKVKAPEFDFNGKIEDLVAKIEEEDLEKKLRLLVKKHWFTIEESVAVERKKRYE